MLILMLILTYFSVSSFLFAAAAKRSTVRFTTIYASLESCKFGLSIGVLNLIFLLTKC